MLAWFYLSGVLLTCTPEPSAPCCILAMLARCAHIRNHICPWFVDHPLISTVKLGLGGGDFDAECQNVSGKSNGTNSSKKEIPGLCELQHAVFNALPGFVAQPLWDGRIILMGRAAHTLSKYALLSLRILPQHNDSKSPGQFTQAQ